MTEIKPTIAPFFEYKISPKGIVVWYKDGKRVKKNEVPRKIKRGIKTQPSEKNVPLTITGGDGEKDIIKSGGCVFCNAPKEFQRGIMWQEKNIEVPLCGSCYYEKTLGEIFEILNKKRGGENG